MSFFARSAFFMLFVVFTGVAGAQDKTPLPVQTPPAPPPPDPKAIAATVNGASILERAVYRAVNQAPPMARDKMREQVLNFLIDNVLVDQYLDQLKIVVEPKDVDTAVKELKDEIAKIPSRKTFEDVLKDLMLTEPELREQLTAEVRWRKFLDKYAPPKALEDFFAANKNFFDGSQVRARHLLVPAKRDDTKEIEAGKIKLGLIRKQIEDKAALDLSKAPTPPDALEKEKARVKALDTAFAEFATKESSCPTKNDGGEVGWFARTGRMVEPFARTAFTLKPYQLSDIVVTEFGCHLILATDTKPGREVKYDEMKEVVKEVYAERMRDAIVTRARPTARIVLAPAPKQ